MSDTKAILDTNIVSYLLRGSTEASLYEKYLKDKLLFITFITVGELYFGAEKARWGKQRRLQLETALKYFVVIPYDNEIARCFGRIVAERERIGSPISCADAWIAACAVRHKVPLVTHNARDFGMIPDLQVVTEVGK
jgi:tRNA(fMet)-specific endonuclease VapC